MKVVKIVSMCLSLLLPALLYTYYYPWLYNKINNYTERGEDLNEVDLLNVFIVFFITWVLISLFFIIVFPIIYLKINK
ncbi:MAG: hypothetical protein CMG74_06790 [Candidatus Marinimicrobia bacterium]|nr:hypothetical protein [Candidatus Neomarinimicrobiota bacterium]|tara:strand:+ start:9423 stop:9656 length:234 start_codon:yes stop_codon:yes gene_type:complete